MAIQTEPTRIQIPFADAGTKNVIPDTNSTPSASQAASWTDGFPAQCSLPLSAGGIPPARADFNGLFNQITQTARFMQDGGVFAWDASTDYGANRLVLGSDGKLYWSVAQSGPSTGTGAVDPTADNGTYWGSIPMQAPGLGDNGDGLATTGWVKALLVAPVYVDGVNGSDANDGFSAGTAVKTIAKGLDILGTLPNLPGAHSRLVIASGTYAEDVDMETLYCDISIDGSVVVNGSFSISRSSVAIEQASTGALTISNSSGYALIIKDHSYADIKCSINIVSSNISVSPVTVYDGCCVNFSGASNTLDIDATNISTNAINITKGSVVTLYQSTNIHGSAINGAALHLEGNCVCVIDNNFTSDDITVDGFYITNHSWIYVSNTNVNITLYGGHLLYTSVFSRMSFEDFGTLTLTRSKSAEAIYSMMRGSIMFNASTSDADTGKINLSLGNYNAIAFGAAQMSNLDFRGYVKVSLNGTCSSVAYSRYMSMLLTTTTVTFSGTPTGKRYQTSDQSRIETYGGGADRFPGTTAGTADAASYSIYH